MSQKTEPLGVRFNPDEKAALERAAKAEDRTLSGLVRRLTADWLRVKGYLPKGDGTP